MYCVHRGTMVVRSCIYFHSVCVCYHLDAVFSKNLANTGHRQLWSCSSLSSENTIDNNPPCFSSLHIWLREIFCIVFTALGFDASSGFCGV